MSKPDPRDIDEYTLTMTVAIPRDANIRANLMEQAERISGTVPRDVEDAFALVITNCEFPDGKFCRQGGGWWFEPAEKKPLTIEELDDATVYSIAGSDRHAVIVFSGGSLTGMKPILGPSDGPDGLVRVAFVEGPEYLSTSGFEQEFGWIDVARLEPFEAPEINPDLEYAASQMAALLHGTAAVDQRPEAAHRFIPPPMGTQIRRHLFDWHATAPSDADSVSTMDAIHDGFHDHAHDHGWHEELNAHCHHEE